MIAIKSNKPLTFNPVSREMGVITVSIDSYMRNTKDDTFTLYITDLVEYVAPVTVKVREVVGLDENNQEVYEMVEKTIFADRRKQMSRTKTYKVEELITLGRSLGISDIEVRTLVEKTDELFRKGLLAITQMECVEGRGIYMSEAGDWFIHNPIELIPDNSVNINTETEDINETE